MKGATFSFQCLMWATAFLGLAIATAATGQGVNFSVKVGAQGMPGTGVATQAASESPSNDAFIGGGCINHVRLLHTLLGLLPGDDIDALCYQFAPFIVDIVAIETEPGWGSVDGIPIFWHFSVDPNASGQALSAVNDEVTTGKMTCGIATIPNEAHGDYFYSSFWMIGGNMLGAYESTLGLQIQGIVFPHQDDDLNALDLNAALINRLSDDPPQFLQPGDLYFSLAAGSPSLMPAAGITQDDILTPNGAGGFQVFRPGIDLGILPGSDPDALFFDRAGTPFFSVKFPMATAALFPDANPGDILVPDGMFFRRMALRMS